MGVEPPGGIGAAGGSGFTGVFAEDGKTGGMEEDQSAVNRHLHIQVVVTDTRLEGDFDFGLIADLFQFELLAAGESNFAFHVTGFPFQDAIGVRLFGAQQNRGISLFIFLEDVTRGSLTEVHDCRSFFQRNREDVERTVVVRAGLHGVIHLLEVFPASAQKFKFQIVVACGNVKNIAGGELDFHFIQGNFFALEFHGADLLEVFRDLAVFDLDIRIAQHIAAAAVVHVVAHTGSQIQVLGGIGINGKDHMRRAVSISRETVVNGGGIAVFGLSAEIFFHFQSPVAHALLTDHHVCGVHGLRHVERDAVDGLHTFLQRAGCIRKGLGAGIGGKVDHVIFRIHVAEGFLHGKNCGIVALEFHFDQFGGGKSSQTLLGISQFRLFRSLHIRLFITACNCNRLVDGADFFTDRIFIGFIRVHFQRADVTAVKVSLRSAIGQHHKFQVQRVLAGGGEQFPVTDDVEPLGFCTVRRAETAHGGTDTLVADTANGDLGIRETEALTAFSAVPTDRRLIAGAGDFDLLVFHNAVVPGQHHFYGLILAVHLETDAHVTGGIRRQNSAGLDAFHRLRQAAEVCKVLAGGSIAQGTFFFDLNIGDGETVIRLAAEVHAADCIFERDFQHFCQFPVRTAEHGQFAVLHLNGAFAPDPVPCKGHFRLLAVDLHIIAADHNNSLIHKDFEAFCHARFRRNGRLGDIPLPVLLRRNFRFRVRVVQVAVGERNGHIFQVRDCDPIFVHDIFLRFFGRLRPHIELGAVHPDRVVADAGTGNIVHTRSFVIVVPEVFLPAELVSSRAGDYEETGKCDPQSFPAEHFFVHTFSFG